MKKSLLLSILMILSFQVFSEEAMGMKEVMERDKTNKKTLYTAQYVIGGLVSIFPGFGLGHVIQGRYMERGWIFTAGTLLTWIGIRRLNRVSSRRVVRFGSFYDSDSKISSRDLLVAGLFLFKIWEMTDIWILPFNYKLVDQNSFEFKPLAFYSPETKFNYGLSLNYKF